MLQGENMASVTCPKCGQVLVNNERICPACHALIPVPSAGNAGTAAGTPSGNKTLRPAAAPVSPAAAASVPRTPAANAASPDSGAKPETRTRASADKTPEKESKLVPILITVAAILSVAILILVIVFLVPRKNKSYRVIKVEDYDGTIDIEHKDESVDVFKGMQLAAGDMVSTGENSWLAMLIDSDKHIGASADTTFYIHAKGNEKKGAISIELEEGSALFTIDQKLNKDSTFKVTTPNATLSVRGTTFNASYDPDTDTTRTSVTEGTVVVKYGDGETEELNAGDTAFITGDEFTSVDRPAFIITRMYSRADYDPASPVSIRFAYTLRGNESKSVWNVNEGWASGTSQALAKEAFDINISYLLPHEEEIKEYMSGYTVERLNQPAPDLPGDSSDVSGWYLDTFSYGSGDEVDVTDWFPETLTISTDNGDRTFHVTQVVMWTQVFDENITEGVVGEAYIKELGFGFYGYSE